MQPHMHGEHDHHGSGDVKGFHGTVLWGTRQHLPVPPADVQGFPCTHIR